MKIRSLILSVCFLFAFMAVAFAAGIDGKWTADFTGPDGQVRTTTFNFKAEGDKLTGTVSGRGGDTAISDGKINGDEISFNVVRETPNGTFKMAYKGKISGDEIKLTRTFEGGQGNIPAQEVVAKRAK